MAGLGHNKPPLVDPDLLDQTDARIAEFADKAKEWLDLGEITSQEQSANLTDFITGARGVFKVVDKARADAKKPHDEASKAVQALFAGKLSTIERIVDRVKPLQAAWLAKENARIEAEQAEKRRLAEAARLEAEAKASIAAAHGDIAGEIAAEEAAKEAAKLQKAAEKPLKANAGSASGAGRTMSLRKTRVAEIDNIRLAFMQFWDRTEVAEVLTRLANAELRGSPDLLEIPGFKVTIKETVA